MDGLLATRDTLYVADLVTHGNLANGAGAGVIYRIRGITPPSPPRLEIRKNNTGLILEWKLKLLVEESHFPDGPWTPVKNAFSPLSIPQDDPQKFTRSKY